MNKIMQSDFYVHFPRETAGLLAHMANEKDIDITTLIAELATEGLKAKQNNSEFKNVSIDQETKEAWSIFANKFDESEWTWPGL